MVLDSDVHQLDTPVANYAENIENIKRAHHIEVMCLKKTKVFKS